REYGETARADAERTAHADFEREGLDRERAFLPVDTHRIEAAALCQENGVSRRFRDTRHCGMANFAQIEAWGSGQSQFEDHGPQKITVRFGILLHHVFERE